MAIRIVARTVDYVQSCAPSCSEYTDLTARDSKGSMRLRAATRRLGRYPAVLERRLSIGSPAIAREEIDRPVWKA
jgi:hypothetical protein